MQFRKYLWPVAIGASLAAVTALAVLTQKSPPGDFYDGGTPPAVLIGGPETPTTEPTLALTETPILTSEPTYTLTPTQSPTATPEPTQAPTPTATPVPTPEPTAYNVDDLQGLQSQLEDSLRMYEGLGTDLSVAVTDLQTGETIAVDGAEPHVPACVINQLAAYTMVKEVAEGRVNVEDIDYELRVGVQQSSPYFIRLGLEKAFGSYEEGVRAVRRFMEDHGIDGTFNHVPNSEAVDEPWTDNILTASEANDALEKLYSNEFYNNEWTDYTLDVMTYDGLAWAIPSGVGPDTTRVAHKVGWYPYAGNLDGDSGIVEFLGDDGNKYAFALTILSQNSVIYFPSAAQDLTGAVYDYFAGKY